MLPRLDDYPIHQVAEPVRRVGTSDRNFHDRYYVNCFPIGRPERADDLFLVVGVGQ